MAFLAIFALLASKCFLTAERGATPHPALLGAYCAGRPGITGLWQVSGRNDVSYRRRVALDTAYSARKSVALDMRILFATVPAVMLRRGSY